MSILVDNTTLLCECGELADYGCDHPGCDALMCVDCIPEMPEDCPNEFCEDHAS